MASWDNAAVVGALGVAFGGATAYIQSALAARAKSGEELHDVRLDAYPSVWRQTATISRYPPAEITWADVERMHLALRSWYYTTGGILLSERSRDRYGDVQELLGAYLLSHRRAGPSAGVKDADYDALAGTCSAFRTALTEDLATRRQRSFVLAVQSRRWHKARAREAQKRIKRFGGTPLRCRLGDMPLPPTGDQSSTRPSKSAKTAP